MIRDGEISQDYLLTVLAEEGGEVVQAAAKCLRFGFNWNEPGYGVNSEYLAKEIGDLLAVVDALKLPKAIIEASRATKIERILKNMHARR
jgi:NTP pyrophosphatase (non-canonical NTP hydrolase)